MKVVLHIGVPKTASSYLRSWLSLNADQVPSLSFDHANRLAIWCCDRQDHYQRSDFEYYVEHFSLSEVIHELSCKRSAGTERLVISSEYFFLARPAAIARTFADLGLIVEKVICFVRRQDYLIASGYAQDIKALRRCDPLELTAGGYTPWYDWGLLRDNYQAAFPSASFVPLEFDHLRRKEDLLRRWKAELDCRVATIDNLPGGDLVNRSLPGELVEICRHANELGDFSLSAWAIAAAHNEGIFTEYRLPRDMQLELRSGYAASNDDFISALPDAEDFQHYTHPHWTIEDGTAAGVCPSVVARLLSLRSAL